ncbi:MAG: hypothetical protein ACKVS9_07815 [Phycisphaerae bacterium]
MRTRVLTGTRQSIADEIARLDVEVREAIVFLDETGAKPTVAASACTSTRGSQPIAVAEFFAEMDDDAVLTTHVDDSREAIYRESPGE